MRRGLGLAVAAALCLPVLLFGSTAPSPARGFVGAYDLKPFAAGLGGFSALWIAPQGNRLIALSDRSFAVTGQIGRDPQGRITGVALSGAIALRGRDNRKLSPGQLDSEGLAVGANGAIYISTEGPARVLRYESLGGAGRQIGAPGDFGTLRPNGALESLALAPDGTLYTLPETTTRDTAAFPLFRYDGTGWSVFAQIPRQDRFLPVSADIGPDGRLYLLFRSFGGFSGFASRLQRMDLSETGLGPAQTLIETPFGLHDNLEGLSVWRDAKGHLIATMIADDNESVFQTTELVEYRLPD